jgi:hypothetical protein
LQFRRDCCEEANHLKASNPELLKAYRAWCDSEGIERPFGARAFGRYMDGSGFKREAGGDKLRVGIALKQRLQTVHRPDLGGKPSLTRQKEKTDVSQVLPISATFQKVPRGCP